MHLILHLLCVEVLYLFFESFHLIVLFLHQFFVLPDNLVVYFFHFSYFISMFTLYKLLCLLNSLIISFLRRILHISEGFKFLSKPHYLFIFLAYLILVYLLHAEHLLLSDLGLLRL